jgi:hypothetical protein
MAKKKILIISVWDDPRQKIVGIYDTMKEAIEGMAAYTKKWKHAKANEREGRGLVGYLKPQKIRAPDEVISQSAEPEAKDEPRKRRKED